MPTENDGGRLRLTFLGTSAGELYPGLWCRCANCEAARHGSPRDRRQSAALYVEMPAAAGSIGVGSVLIDFPSEIATQAERHGVDLPALEQLLVTHSHGDHWFPYLLRWRSRPAEICADGAPAQQAFGAPRFTELPLLNVYGNSAVRAILDRELGACIDPYALAYHEIETETAFAAGKLTVTPLAANHDVGREKAVHYVLQTDGTSVLYGLDGDTFLPETREALSRFRFDAVILESTYGHGDGKNHRNFARVIEEAEWLRGSGVLAPTGRVIATHFSPHHCPPHEATARYLAEHGIEAAWDGWVVEVSG